MLEDESGRLHLTGEILRDFGLVTGCIVAVVGTENAQGEFEVLDLKIPDLAPQPDRWLDETSANGDANGHSKKETNASLQRPRGGKIAIVSGLGISGVEADGLTRDLLEAFLLGESGDQNNQSDTSCISRLIIAGSSLDRAPRAEETGTRKKKYGYDASAYNPDPTTYMDNFLTALLPSIPITLLPGELDPVAVSLPQQPLHAALFAQSRAYASHPQAKEAGWFDNTTNPWEGTIDGWRFLGNAGQPISDIFKYVEGDDRLSMMESILRWRIQAPTAPDTLCKFV